MTAAGNCGDHPRRRSACPVAGHDLSPHLEREVDPAQPLLDVGSHRPDIAGHAEGWMSEGYLSAVADADRAVGTLVSALKASGRWPKTALIITADHGGNGRRHKPVIPENWTIPWLVVAPGVSHGSRIQRTLRIYDTAPTALALLGLKLSPGGEGRVIEEIMRAPRGAGAPN